MCGLENQTAIDYSMPLRVIAYDGASYKKQIIDKKKKGKSERTSIHPNFYPVITLVVYMGDKPWDKNKTLHEVLNIKPELRPFVNDYKAHITDYRTPPSVAAIILLRKIGQLFDISMVDELVFSANT